MSIEDRIKDLVSNDDEYILGFADMRGLINDQFKGFDFCIVICKRLDDKIVDSIATGPNMDYCNLYNLTNHQLAEIAKKISDELEELHISSILIKPTISDEEVDNRYDRTLTCDFSHKMAATRAGLDWENRFVRLPEIRTKGETGFYPG